MMAASSSNSWLNTSLLSPSAQHHGTHNGLYSSDMQMHSSVLLQHPQVDFGNGADDPCSTFCEPHRSLDFHQSPDGQQLQDFGRSARNLDFHYSPERQQIQDYSRPRRGSPSSGQVGGTGEISVHVSARKVHKADREKLRRDRLNEQFVELAGVLDPGRPKNDKATILGDSVQVVRELRSELKRLRDEHDSLLVESRDLVQEKTELREEKSTLKAETEQLQAQVQQRFRLMMPWIGMDPSVMMGAPPFGYHVQMPQPVSAPPPSSDVQQGSLSHSGGATPLPIPLPPTPPSPFGLHPLQAYAMLGNRVVDGSSPYLPYPLYPPQVTTHSHVERPYPQYPSPIQPLPGYLLQVQGHQGQPQITGAPPGTAMYHAFAPGMPMMPPLRPQATQPSLHTRGGATGDSGLQSGHCSHMDHPYAGHSSTTSSLQLSKQPQPPLREGIVELSSSDGKVLSPNDESGESGRSSSGRQKENQPTDGVVDSTNPSPACTADSPGICSPGTLPSACIGGEVISPRGKDRTELSETQGTQLCSAQ